jgi:CxxC motif-containing protein (DUF1111 family)
MTGSGAFAQPVPGLEGATRRTFAVGNNFFNDNWVTAPASTTGRDGLGPLFNAQSCSSCHFRDGRGRPPERPDDPERGLLLRLSVPGPDGPVPHPTLGDQLQDRAIVGVPVEGRIVLDRTPVRGAYDDGTPYELEHPTYAIELPDGTLLGPDDVQISPRIAPQMIGVGLLEAIPTATIIDLADPEDEDDDGISGRAHLVVDPATGDEVLGRFGWKAAVPTVRQQTANAFLGDIGITSSLHTEQACTDAQAACRAAPHGGEPELVEDRLDQVTFYARTLAVPARRDAGAARTSEGEDLVAELGCTSCHVAELRTGDADVPDLAHQVIRPYTDLLLHDMGPGLADDRPDQGASGTEWRTPPLWGLGLVETVNRHTRFLHDGRARNLTEAILWHGGEARAARDRFRALTADERAAVVAFLESL